ncbi:MAG TPA: HipA family kinase [Acidobacteriaceae bacterium]|nr:HipA family kinase [Acidobacteriaceae bacterium]
MSIPVVNAVRYITSMREGGSLPALIEADDNRTYVVKLRGAGQGARPLAAELMVGEMARMLGLRVPRLALVNLDASFGRSEPDAEVQDLFKASTGLNVGLEFLAEATVFDAAAGDSATPSEASQTVWLDAFVRNVDRTPRNTNLLMKSERLWLIDHNAALVFHFDWSTAEEKALSPFAEIRKHVLLPWATEVNAAAERAARTLNEDVFEQLVSDVPAEFLPEYDGMSTQEQRDGYRAYFRNRLANARIFEEEIARARTATL